MGLYDYGNTGRAVGVFVGILDRHVFEFKWRWLKVGDDEFSKDVPELFNGAGRVELKDDNVVGAYWMYDALTSSVPLKFRFASKNMPDWTNEVDFKRFEFFL